MAGNTWTVDAPSGVYKNHYMSKRMRVAAIQDTVFMDHTSPVDGYGRKQGESVTITQVQRLNEPTNGQLIEGVPTPEYQIGLSTHAVTVTEWGGAIPFTSLFDDFSEFDMYSQIQRLLREQMTLVFDTMVATAMKQSLIKYAITGVASATITTNGVFGATSSAPLTMYHVEQISDYLYDTLQAPETDGGGYTAICRTRAIRSLHSDPDWEKWFLYVHPEEKYKGEAGRALENVRFIRTNHSNALGNVGSGAVLGECLFFGGDVCSYAEAFAPELRVGVPQDGGRSQMMLWYGIAQSKLTYPTANAGEARLVHVGSL